MVLRGYAYISSHRIGAPHQAQLQGLHWPPRRGPRRRAGTTPEGPEAAEEGLAALRRRAGPGAGGAESGCYADGHAGLADMSSAFPGKRLPF